MQRLEAIARSPILSHFTESLNGAASLRAYGLHHPARFQARLHGLLDQHHSVILCLQSSLAWLALRAEFISTMLMGLSGVFAVASRGDVAPGLSALTIVYSITLTSFLNFAVRLGSMIEALMASVQRIEEYTKLPSEAALYTDALLHWGAERHQLPSSHSSLTAQQLSSLPDSEKRKLEQQVIWPNAGQVSIRRLALRYRPELDDVLHGITLDIRPGERVGIIGRTGSGKSTLSLALFRLIEARSGFITIDGLRLDQLGLQQLRSRITIIPQEPTLFARSLRLNLDPFGQHDTDTLWSTLDDVGLGAKFRSLPGQLDYVLSESESLSVGERQLVCVCRAMLRQTRVLVLDECSASLDVASDTALQRCLRTRFAHCTILCIAHRLSTIIDFDRILCLSDGRVAEFDSPYSLLQQQDSLFRSLVQATGAQSAAHLAKLAEEAQYVSRGLPPVQSSIDNDTEDDDREVSVVFHS